MAHWELIYLLKMVIYVIFHSYVSLPEGNLKNINLFIESERGASIFNVIYQIYHYFFSQGINRAS